MGQTGMLGFIALAVFHVAVLGRPAVTSAAATDGVRANSRGPSRADGGGECASARDASRGESSHLVYPYIGNRMRTGASPSSNATRPEEPPSSPKNLFLFLNIGGTKYRLKLKLNEEILKANVTAQEDRQVAIKAVEPCFYQGTFTRDGHAENFCMAAVSMCHGLRGFIRINESMYTVRPFVDNQDKNIHCRPHIIQPIGRVSAHFLCEQGVSRSSGSQLPFEVLDGTILTANPSIGNTVQITERTRVLRLAIMVDNAFLHRRNDGSGLSFNYVSLLVNAVDMFFRRLNLRVSLICYQAWRSKDEFQVVRSSKENLLNLIAHMPKLRVCTAYDAAVLLSGQSVDEEYAGSSVQDSICTDRAAIVVHGDGTVEQLPSTARIIAHHLGHVLGLLHDGDGCICRESKDCMMNGDLQEPAWDFSQCSRSRFDTLWKYGPASCLSQRKHHLSNAYQSYCGNGVLERGEQCDCGPAAKCHLVDPCCDGATCMLKVWASCRSGTCCEGCRVRNSTQVCRSAKTDCDVPEHCDGLSGECPPDVVIQDGEPCAAAVSTGLALCYGGQCVQRDAQCERLWGSGSSLAGDLCYLLNNPQGTEYGHCGHVTGSSTYARCSSRDAPCGLLQCSGGSLVPREHGVSYRIETIGMKGINQYQCKSVNAIKALASKGQAGAVDTDFLVADGTKCGEGSVCIAQSCLNVSALPGFRPCPYDAGGLTCSGHGRCTSIGVCHCNADFGLPDCSLPLNVSVVLGRARSGGGSGAAQPSDVGPHGPADTGGLLQVVELKWLIIIAVSLAVLVVGLVLAFIFCMRQRRYCVTKQDVPRTNGKAVCQEKNCECRDKEAVTASKRERTKRKRRRRFRKRSLWSDSDSDSTSDEESRNLAPPIIVHNEPAASDQRLRQPERGILKKKTLSLIGEENDDDRRRSGGEEKAVAAANDDGSVSSFCSCPADGHCSCSGDDDGDDGRGSHHRRAVDDMPAGSIEAATCSGVSGCRDEAEPDVLGLDSSALQQQLPLPSLGSSGCCLPAAASGGQRGRRAALPRDDSGHSTELSPTAADGGSILLPSSDAAAFGGVVSDRCRACRGPSSGEGGRCSRLPCYAGQPPPSSSLLVDSATDSAVELCDALMVTSSVSTLNEACIVSTAPSSSCRRHSQQTPAVATRCASAACARPRSCSGSDRSSAAAADDGQAAGERGRRATEQPEPTDGLRLYELSAGQLSPAAAARLTKQGTRASSHGVTAHAGKLRPASYGSDSCSSVGSSSECSFGPEPGDADAAAERLSLQTHQMSP